MNPEEERPMQDELIEREGDAAIKQVEDLLSDLDRRARALVMEHPVLSLVGAVSVGYLVARIFSRR